MRLNLVTIIAPMHEFCYRKTMFLRDMFKEVYMDVFSSTIGINPSSSIKPGLSIMMGLGNNARFTFHCLCVSLSSLVPRISIILVHQHVAVKYPVPLSREIGRRLGRRALSGHICLFVYSNQPEVLEQDNPKSSRRKFLGHSTGMLTLVIPPSTTKSVPFTKLLSSLARNRTA